MDGYGYECCKYANYYAKQESQLKGIQLQLEKEDLLEIKAGESIPFNRYRTQLSCYIGYDCATRAIYIMQSGNYYIEWWVATESIMGGKDTFVAFSILSSQGHEIKAFSPNTLGQITGNGLIGLCASPAAGEEITIASGEVIPFDLQLINYSGIPIKLTAASNIASSAVSDTSANFTRALVTNVSESFASSLTIIKMGDIYWS